MTSFLNDEFLKIPSYFGKLSSEQKQVFKFRFCYFEN